MYSAGGTSRKIVRKVHVSESSLVSKKLYVASFPTLARFLKLVRTHEEYELRSIFENHANAGELQPCMATFFISLNFHYLTCNFRTFFGCCLRPKTSIRITLTNRRFGSFAKLYKCLQCHVKCNLHIICKMQLPL